MLDCKQESKKEVNKIVQRKNSCLYDGKVVTILELSKLTGIHLRTLQVRIRDQGMTVEDALSKPYKKSKKVGDSYQ